MAELKCHYETGAYGPFGVTCSGAVTSRVHDRRGCVPVCDAHAAWRATTSQAMGHSADCPLRTQPILPWKQVTEL